MKELKGKYTNAKVFTDNADEGTLEQVQMMIDNEITEGSSVRIMPDCHKGKGCTIGTTMTIGDKVVPNLVGVDIGCGVLCCEIPRIYVMFEDMLDSVIRSRIPSGFSIHNSAIARFPKLKDLRCLNDLVNIYNLDIDKVERSIGTLGGGNHFIEYSRDDDYHYLFIHTGSRNLGKRVCDYYQCKAITNMEGKMSEEKSKILSLPEKEREQALKDFYKVERNYNLAYLEGQDKEDYLHDMMIVQEFANFNRYVICDEILRGFGIDNATDKFNIIQSIHNYIEEGTHILRKGAISAYEGQELVIPINMRDGVIIGKGKGNPDWNYSAPHGAGRVLSRGQAKKTVSMEEYKKSMEGIYSTCINESTLDECPMAYKPKEEILNNIGDTVEIVKIVKPRYNFKAN